MKKRKANKMKKLNPCTMEVYSSDEAAMFDLLLCRVIGQGNFLTYKKKSPKRYRFLFWATDADEEIIEALWDKVIQSKWDGVEDVLLEER